MDKPTNNSKCKCTDAEHDHTKPCSHGGVSGLESDWDNWICNWCDHVEGNVSPRVIDVHADFVHQLQEMGKRK